MFLIFCSPPPPLFWLTELGVSRAARFGKCRSPVFVGNRSTIPRSFSRHAAFTLLTVLFIVAGCGATRRTLPRRERERESYCCCVVVTPSPRLNIGKSKAVPFYSMKACGRLELQLHSFLALALDGGGWSASCPDLPPTPGKIRVPIKWEAGWKILPVPGLEPRFVLPVASPYGGLVLKIIWRYLHWHLSNPYLTNDHCM
jgi:hypothetical protein